MPTHTEQVPFLVRFADVHDKESEPEEYPLLTAEEYLNASDEMKGPFHTRCGHPRRRDD